MDIRALYVAKYERDGLGAWGIEHVAEVVCLPDNLGSARALTLQMFAATAWDYAAM